MTETRKPVIPVKAYENRAFLDRPEARSIRILSEYLEPEARFEDMHIRDTVVFFGSARIKSMEEAEKALKAAEKAGEGIDTAARDLKLAPYYENTRELAHRITEWSKGLGKADKRFVVCSGGGPGIMEAANRGASEARGLNIGLNITLPFEQPENIYITEKLGFEFHYFFMRKFWFVYLAKALVVMPGGIGTLNEFWEVLTLLQTKKVNRPLPIVLFGTKYWDKVFNLEALVEFGTIDREDVDLVFKTDSVDEAYDYLIKELTRHALERPGGSM